MRDTFTIDGRRSRSFASLRMTAYLVLMVGGLLIAGCRQDMHNQPKFIPQRGTDFFADHRSARPQVVNTVARGQLQEDSYFYTGTVLGANGYREEKNMLPFPATMAVLEKGQERFNVYCTPCHSRVGNGLGAIVSGAISRPATSMTRPGGRSLSATTSMS